MKLWKTLTITTPYTSIEACISNLNMASNKQGMKFWNKGIIGEIHPSGRFDFILNRGRYKEYHYVGQMRLVNDVIVLDGVVQPLTRNTILLKIALVIFGLAGMYEFVKNIGSMGVVGTLLNTIVLVVTACLALSFLYLILRFNAYVAGTKIKEILENTSRK